MSRVSSVDRCRSDNFEDAPRLPPHALCARDVMITNPKTLHADATVEEVRAVLVDDHVHMVLLTDGGTLRGTLTRADLPPSLPDSVPGLPWAGLTGRTVTPETPLDRVRAMLGRAGSPRLAVVGADRTLLGLVCLKRSGRGFCSDADVASRAATETTTTKDGVTA